MVKGKVERDINLYIAHNLIDVMVAFQSARDIQVDGKNVSIRMRVRFHLGKNKPFAGLISMINQSIIPMGYSSIVVQHTDENPTINNPYVAKCELKIRHKSSEGEKEWIPTKMEQQEIRDAVISMIDELDGFLFKKKIQYVAECKKHSRNFVLWSIVMFASHACVSTIFCPYMPSNWHVFGFNVMIYAAIIYIESMLLHKCFDVPIYLARKEMMSDIWDAGNIGNVEEFNTD